MYWKIQTTMPEDAEVLVLKMLASFYTISLTQIFLFREQNQQDDNEVDAIFSFFCHSSEGLFLLLFVQTDINIFSWK